MVFSFSFGTYPTQCQDLTVNWSGGSAPYHVLLVPIGDASQVTGQPENRVIVDQTITDPAATSYTFKLLFPGRTQFVPVVYDAAGLSSGATGVPTTVAVSDDKSCLLGPSSPKFDFFITPFNVLNQCQQTELGWNSSAKPPVIFYGLIPGGQSFQIPVPSGAQGSFNWIVNAREGSSLLIMAGDSTGLGAGGSAPIIKVGPGSDSCLNAQSPSSTLGSPAGSVTGSPGGGGSSGGGGGGGSSGGGSSSSKNNVGPIVGGVVGGIFGLAALLLVLLFFHRRRKFADKRQSKHQEVDLLQGPHGDPNSEGHSDSEPPDTANTTGGRSRPTSGTTDSARAARDAGWYIPDIFSTRASTDGQGPSTGRPSMSTARPLSGASTPSFGHTTFGAGSVAGGPVPTETSEQSSVPTSAALSNARRKQGAPPQLRPVNFIIHDDAGVSVDPSAGGAGPQEEVVELPPTYNEVSRNTATAASGRVRADAGPTAGASAGAESTS